MPHVEFILCGAGDPNPFLVSSNIKYNSPIHGNERSDYLGSCVAVLSPTVYLEPFGCAQVEAQLCGTPVICSDWGGMSETVEQFKTGLLCHTLEDYCYGIQMAIDGMFDRNYIRKRAENMYDMYKIAYKYEYIFKSVLDVYRPGKRGWYSRDNHIKNVMHLTNPKQQQQEQEPRIYKFLVYYGKFPNYFQLYLDSLEINKDILTVFLITDIDIDSYIVPSNLIYIKLPIQNIRERASKFIFDTYNTKVDPEKLIQTNYKLVDFKIVFPILFNDILEKYNISNKDYVGWGDCDIIYGKFSNFIDLKNNNYEILGGWHGHFTAIKNTKSFKNNFINIPNYLELITDYDTYVTDEIAYRKPLIEYLKVNNYEMFYANNYFCDIVPPLFYYRFRKNHRDLPKNFFDCYNSDKNISHLIFDKNNETLKIKYDNQDTIKEVLYCHLQKRKMALPFTQYKGCFYINEHSFSEDLL
jgi:hypothetical protein